MTKEEFECPPETEWNKARGCCVPMGELKKQITRALVDNVAYAVLRKGEAPTTTVYNVIDKAKKEFEAIIKESGTIRDYWNWKDRWFGMADAEAEKR